VSGRAGGVDECRDSCNETRCSTHGGRCSDVGVCECQLGWFGAFCDIPFPDIAPGSEIRDFVEPMESKTFKLTTNHSAGTLTIRFQSLSVDGDPDLKIYQTRLPSPFANSPPPVQSITKCDNCFTRAGGPLPSASTVTFDAHENVYYLVVYGMCCARAPFSLIVSGVGISRPYIQAVDLLDGASSLVAPTSVATTLLIHGDFSSDSFNANLSVSIGWFERQDDSATCSIVSINASTVGCVLAAQAINRLCASQADMGQGRNLTIVLINGTQRVRSSAVAASLRCEVADSMRLFDSAGYPVQRISASFVRWTTASAPECRGAALSLPSNTTRLAACLEAASVLGQRSAATASRALLPYGSVRRGDVLALQINDAVKIMPSDASQWWPRSSAVADIAAALVATASNEWFPLEVRYAPAGLYLLVPSASASRQRIPAGEELRVAIGVRAVNSTRMRWGYDDAMAVSVAPEPSNGRLTLNQGVIPRESLPRQPYRLTLAPLRIFIEGANIGIPADVVAALRNGSNSKASTPTVSYSLAAAIAQAALVFEPLFTTAVFHSKKSQRVLGESTTFEIDRLTSTVSANVLHCGVPLQPVLQPNVTAVLFGDPDHQLTDDLLTFSCPSRVTSVALASPHSHHAMLSSSQERIRLIGEFASFPSGAILTAPNGTRIPLDVMAWAATQLQLKPQTEMTALMRYNITVLFDDEDPLNTTAADAYSRQWPITATWYPVPLAAPPRINGASYGLRGICYNPDASGRRRRFQVGKPQRQFPRCRPAPVSPARHGRLRRSSPTVRCHE
jgi:hypothetical protein